MFDMPALPQGWEYDSSDNNLICPCGDEIELDGSCQDGCVSPLRALGADLMERYRVTVTIEETAVDPREAAEKAREDLLQPGLRLQLLTVVSLRTEDETLVDLGEPVSGRACAFDRRLAGEGR